MRIAFYDPKESQHEYVTKMYFNPMRQFLQNNGRGFQEHNVVGTIMDSTVICFAGHLNQNTVALLKHNGNKIVAFSCTDSSYLPQVIRAWEDFSKIDLIFMLTGIQLVNEGYEMVLDKDFKVQLEKRQFLPENDWKGFNEMRLEGRLKSLPYVHWDRQPDVPAQPYNKRSQKVLIRGGHHMRRFLLALELMKLDKLDCNSGFYTADYFRDDMNPQFRYCEDCRNIWKKNRMYPLVTSRTEKRGCRNEAMLSDSCDVSDLGYWNNKCPESFYRVASAKMLNDGVIIPDAPFHLQNLMNARWLSPRHHSEMLARITFTSDLKWLFSIYAAQRFWDAAMVGCVNVLPTRTIDQEYFPNMEPDVHYITYGEKLIGLDEDFEISEKSYNEISSNSKTLYDVWIRPSVYQINTNLLQHIFNCIESIK